MASEDIDISFVKSLLSYDPFTGIIRWKVDRAGQRLAGTAAGNMRSRYTFISINKKRVAAHRIAWAIYYSVWPTDVIDHVDGNGHNNRIFNLRQATQSQNLANQRLSKANTSGIKGVSWVPKKQKWQVGIKVNGKRIGLGYFVDKEEAGKAYAKAAIHYFGDYARYATSADAA